MLYATLRTLTDTLSSHLKLSLGLKDEIVSLSPLDNTSVASPPNKVFVTLANIERETSAGISFHYRSTSGDRLQKNAPAWQLNVYVIFAAVFAAKQYEDGVRVLSSVFRFLQNNALFSVQSADRQLSIEPVNLPFSELSHIWGIYGGTYFPSVLCKIRMVHIDSREIKGTATPITQSQS